jgi:nitroreductase
MTFQELIQQRQSIRKYQDKQVEPEKIDKLVEAFRLAPSASNSQPWKLIIVDEPELKDKVAKATYNKVIPFNRFAVQAPVMVVIVAEPPKVITQLGGFIKNKDFPQMDIGIAAEHFCLQAAEMGLGTCMIGWFNEKKVRKLLNIPKRKRIGLLISLGYPPEDYKIRKKIRKSAEEICSYNEYT